MPELPEVETTRRALAPHIEGQVLRAMRVHQPSMRWPVDPRLPGLLSQQRLLRTSRRGKYLLLEFETGVLLVHLGMSGSLRIVPAAQPLLKHDHVEWAFEHCTVRLNDPRRFGAVVWHDHLDGTLASHRLLARLGVEPFSDAFTPEHLWQGLKKKNKAVKQALLDGDIVVGVGNIYASESLFLAGIHPLVNSRRISLKRARVLHQAILDTLSLALESGGSTLRDYVNPQGEPGSYFKIHARVYDRTGQACQRCGHAISKIVQNGRATWYCKGCQH